MIENTKKALYATVGAPILTAKRVNEKFQEITSKLRETDFTKEYEAWAAEGEKLVDRFQPTIDEWSAKLDETEMPAQVGKLREQLDDMVENWRKNFRPAEKTVTVPVEEEKTEKAAPSKTVNKPAAKKPAAKTTTRKPAAKATSVKKPAAKAPAAKAPKKA